MTLLQTYGLSLDQFTWQSFVDWGRVDRVCLGESMRTIDSIDVKKQWIVDTDGTFDLLKAIWIYESCEIMWNSQNHKIRSFPEVPGSFFQFSDPWRVVESFFQELYDEVYEKKHSKLEPVDGELVRHVAYVATSPDVSGGPWFFHRFTSSS